MSAAAVSFAGPAARPQRLGGALLTLPALLFIGALFLLPVLQLLALSVSAADAGGGWRLSFSAYVDFLGDPHAWGLLARTLRIGLLTVLTCLLLAFPVALLMRGIAPRWRSLLFIALLSPLLTSVVVRTLAWVVLLGPKGLANAALAWAGFAPLALMYNDFGVVVGLTHVFFGYMLLAVSASVLKLDERLLLAAANLGAGRWQVLWRVVLPLCLPGIAAGAVLVFTMSASAYIVPVLLGGTATKVMATEVYDLAINYLEWREAAVVAAVLFALVWAVVALLARLGEGRGAAGAAR